MKRANWLLLIVLMAVLAAGGQLMLKAQVEPLQRPLGLAVYLNEVTDSHWWAELKSYGVNFAVVTKPEELEALPQDFKPVLMVDQEDWLQWRDLGLGTGLETAALLFVDNLFAGAIGEEVKNLDLPLGLIEFKGAGNFADIPEYWTGRLIRVYNQAAHPFVNEYTIAARERQVDLLVIHLDPAAEPPLLLPHGQAIAQALEEEGFTFASALQAREVLVTSNLAYWLLVLGLAALLAWLLIYSFKLRRRPALIIALLSVVGGSLIGARYMQPWLLRQLQAFATAIIFPMAGVLVWIQNSRRPRRGAEGRPMPAALADFLVILLFAGGGGLLLHAFLAQAAFHLNILQFKGVKLAYLIPLGLTFLAVLGHWLRYGLGDGLRLRNPYMRLLLSALVLLIFAAAVFVLLNRTGNQSLVRIFPIELKFRDWLQDSFWVRPRSKEFLGYPLLLAGLYLWRRRARLLGGLGILVGMTAPLSLVNTFAHIHHPIVLSLSRGVLGLAIGFFLGFVALLLIKLIYPKGEAWS